MKRVQSTERPSSGGIGRSVASDTTERARTRCEPLSNRFWARAWRFSARLVLLERQKPAVAYSPVTELTQVNAVEPVLIEARTIARVAMKNWADAQVPHI